MDAKRYVKDTKKNSQRHCKKFERIGGRKMTKDEKIIWLVENAPSLYDKAKMDAIKTCDEATPVFCYCGKLATGLHTYGCRKFQNNVKSLILENTEIRSALRHAQEKNAGSKEK